MTQGNSAKAAWTRASTYFNVHDGKIEQGAADNILIAWPPILSFIQSQLPDIQYLEALDYGCGTGGFSEELARIGFRVTGIDYAEGMIRKAREHCDPKIRFIISDHPNHQKFRLVSSIMVLQFIDDIERIFREFAHCIESKGILVFAVFNPDWVEECLLAGEIFSDFDIEKPAKGVIHLANNKFPVFIRNSSEYDKLAEINGFTKILEVYPPFTKEFLVRYPTSLPTHCSEYLIMGFVRK